MKNRKTFTFLAVVFGAFIILETGHSLMAAQPVKIESGKKVTLGYKLFVEGSLIETADSRNPFIYLHGKNQIVPGLEKGLTGLRVGEKKTIRVQATEAYGPVNPKAYKEFQKGQLPSEIPMKVGTLVEARSPEGDRLLVKIKEVREKTVILDFNHPLAGKNLEFQIEVLNIA